MRPLILVTLFVVLAPPMARADERQDRARELNGHGNASYDLGAYDDALAKFTEAYRAYPDPRLLFNIGQAHRKKRDYERALDAYRAYLRNSPQATNRTVVEELILELDKLVAAQRVSDAQPPQGTEASPAAALPPVVSKITEPRAWYANPAGWVLTAGGTVAAGIGVGFFVSTSSLEDELAVAPESEKAGIRSEISTRRTIGTILAIAGGLAVAGGVTIFVVSPRTVTREIVPIRDLKLSVGPSWIGLSGRF